MDIEKWIQRTWIEHNELQMDCRENSRDTVELETFLDEGMSNFKIRRGKL